MATLAEIKARPETYLGEGEPQDYETFISAVEALVEAGWPEVRAVELVWNDGDFLVRASAIVGGWIPTHVITHDGRSEPVMLEENVFYTAEEWLSAAPADWELVDGEVLFQGQVPLGEYKVVEL